jgi:PST family polysaccharide transporter
VEQFGSVVNFASVRLSIPVFARLQQKRAQLMRALTEGMSLQLVTLGPILAGLGLLTPWVLPMLLGPGWLPAAEVYPFIAVGYLAGTAFSLHLSVLWVVQKVLAVALFRLIYVCFFAGAALVLVPRMGLFGFGWACLLALPAWLLFLVWFRLYVGRPVTPQAGIWFMAWAVALFSLPLGYLVWLGVLVPLAWPESRKELLRAATMLVEMVRKNGAKP